MGQNEKLNKIRDIMEEALDLSEELYQKYFESLQNKDKKEKENGKNYNSNEIEIIITIMYVKSLYDSELYQ